MHLNGRFAALGMYASIVLLHAGCVKALAALVLVSDRNAAHLAASANAVIWEEEAV